ncbi:MAG: hypothetical protein LBB74_06905 [Chitinispirillales bacterium]|jgi:hypothetical protein|nr:hypothetical protein [Chitinispirillales bacterium]
MASKVEDLTIAYEEEGVLVVKELDKVILSKGAWATVLYRYRQWEKAKEGYGQDRYSIRRYRKMDDEYRQQNKFNISSRDQALKIIEALRKWIDLEGASGAGSSEDDEG